jgi:DNA-binding MarR family transcriptional regulator
MTRPEPAGFVTRALDPTDRRAVLVRLTERGETLAEQSLKAVIAADEASSNRPANGSATW